MMSVVLSLEDPNPPPPPKAFLIFVFLSLPPPKSLFYLSSLLSHFTHEENFVAIVQTLYILYHLGSYICFQPTSPLSPFSYSVTHQVLTLSLCFFILALCFPVFICSVPFHVHIQPLVLLDRRFT